MSNQRSNQMAFFLFSLSRLLSENGARCNDYSTFDLYNEYSAALICAWWWPSKTTIDDSCRDLVTCEAIERTTRSYCDIQNEHRVLLVEINSKSDAEPAPGRRVCRTAETNFLFSADLFLATWRILFGVTFLPRLPYQDCRTAALADWFCLFGRPAADYNPKNLATSPLRWIREWLEAGLELSSVNLNHQTKKNSQKQPILVLILDQRNQNTQYMMSILHASEAAKPRFAE